MPKLPKFGELTATRRIFLLGVIFFVYSLGVSAAIQTYIVPNIFPQFDLGDGLIVPDSTGFDQAARIKAHEIRERGWGAWELRPQTHSPAGVASAFYALWTPKPYSLLPFNALVHALSGCLVLWLLLNFFSWKPALFGSALFVINPAAMEWVAQIHRDGVFILGNLMVLASIAQLLDGLKSANIRTMARGLLAGLAGTLLVWVARPYWIQVLIVIVLLCLLLIGISRWATRTPGNGKNLPSLSFLSFVICLLLFQGWTEKTESPGREGDVRTGTHASQTYIRPMMTPWIKTQGIPDAVEKKLLQISVMRYGVVTTGGNSIVDGDVTFNSAGDFVTYFPRALQLGMLSPLPELWRGEGSTPATTMARKIMGGATLVFYFCLFGLLAGIVLHRKNPILWIALTFSLVGILVFTYVYPNVGTLLRLRYGFYMFLIAFGAANIAELSLGWLRRRRAGKY